MRNGSHSWDPGVALGWRRGGSCHSFLSFSRGICEDTSSTMLTTTTPTVKSSLLPSTVCSSISSGTFSANTATTVYSTNTSMMTARSGGSGTDATGKSAGTLFQEKIRLLKKSMQEQRAAREQQRREWNACESVEKMHSSTCTSGRLPGGDRVNETGGRAHGKDGRDVAAQTQTSSFFFRPNFPANTGGNMMADGENGIVAMSTTPPRGNKRPEVEKEDPDAMDLTASPAVVVVLDESPHSVEHRDAATAAMKESSSFSPDAHNCTVTAAHGDNSEGNERRNRLALGNRGEKEKNRRTVDQDVSAITKDTEVSQPSTSHSTHHRFTLVSPTAANGVTGDKNFIAPRGVGGSVGMTRRNEVTRKADNEIRTLRAPSEGGRSRLHEQLDTRKARLPSSPPPSDEETKRMSVSSDDGEEPVPRRPSRRASAFAHAELEKLTAGCGENHALFRGARSVSSENSIKLPMRMIRGRSGGRDGVGGEAETSTRTSKNNCADYFASLRSASPILLQKWVEKDMKPATSTAAHIRPSPSVGKTSQRPMTGESSAATRRRQCLLRQIRLIDWEIHRMEKVPWSKSLRSGTGSLNTLHKEKSKLLAIRKQYEWELSQVVGKGDVRTTELPPPPPKKRSLASLPSYRQRPRTISSSAPFHGPSIYESILQQQQQQQMKKVHQAGQATCKQSTFRFNEGRSGTGCRANSMESKGLPPRVGIPENSISRTSHLSSRGSPNASKDFIIKKNGNKFHAVGSHDRKNRVGCRRSISLDAERMAALYARSASSSQSTWRDGTPMRKPMSNVADCDHSYVTSSSTTGHENEREAPMYWRLAQVKRDSEWHESGSVREMSGFRPSCGSASPSPVRTMRPPSVRGRGSGFVGDWGEAELCADVPADQYYCAEYGEEETLDEPRITTHGGAGAKGNESLGHQFSANFVTRGPKGQLERRPRTRSALRSEEGQADVRASGRRVTPNRSDLCYRLRAPMPHKVPAENKSRSLYFCQDSTVQAKRTKTFNEVSKHSKLKTRVQAGSRQQESQRRVAGSSPSRRAPHQRTPVSLVMNNVSSREKQPEQSHDYRRGHSSESHKKMSGHSRPSRATLLSPSACERVGATGGFSAHDYSVDQEGEVDWISPSRVMEHTQPPATMLSPSPASTAQFSRPRSSQERKDDEGLPFSVRHHDTKVAVNFREGQTQRRSQQLYMTDQRTPSRDPQRQQQQRRQEQQLIESSSRISEVHVSPLTEYSPGGGGGGGDGDKSPAAALQYRTTSSYAMPFDGATKEPSLRQIMNECQRRTSLNKSASMPFQQERNILLDAPSGNAKTFMTPQSPFSSKSPHRFGDDRTNAPFLSSGTSCLHATRRVGAGGITLRQLFGHEQTSVISSPVDGIGTGGAVRSSTDVLLGRINEMRAMMK
ncbi:hypothetical protein MOQ_008249 [Trypanosoma cruzi marinkellei]|uniref:Uncharacterized protein n=1 Tax=Trypanosoma cruzi marinkellei TaxID=85056 RepID=K2N091_TRYCR|nr:hypothetical protein MOQ_008249 [Trypanosoma cruzi marinkellei]